MPDTLTREIAADGIHFHLPEAFTAGEAKEVILATLDRVAHIDALTAAHNTPDPRNPMCNCGCWDKDFAVGDEQ